MRRLVVLLATVPMVVQIIACDNTELVELLEGKLVNLHNGDQMVEAVFDNTMGDGQMMGNHRNSDYEVIDSVHVPLVDVSSAQVPGGGAYTTSDNWYFSPTPASLVPCKDVYENHNDPTYVSRYNIVFVTRGFESESAELSALCRIIDLDGGDAMANAYGMMQISPFNELRHHFNFFYVTSAALEPMVTGDVSRREWETMSASCQRFLPNDAYVFLLQPNMGANTAWVASYGRGGAGLSDCRMSADCALADLQASVHEIMHTIFSVPDEYETYPGRESKTFDLKNDALSTLQQGFVWACNRRKPDAKSLVGGLFTNKFSFPRAAGPYSQCRNEWS